MTNAGDAVARTKRAVDADAAARAAALPGGAGLSTGEPVIWVRWARLSGWFDDCWKERLRQAA